MLKKAGKNLVKDQVEKFLEGKALESRSWKIVHKTGQLLTKPHEANKQRK